MITAKGRAFYLEAAKLLDRNSPNYGVMVRMYLRNYQREFRRCFANSKEEVAV